MSTLNRTILLSLLLMPACLLAQPKPIQTDPSADVAAIQASRAASNRAIEARDLTEFGQTMLPDIHVTRGSGSHVSGRDSVLASVAVQFKEPNFLGYVRYIDSVQVSSTGPLAAERGHWMGRFRRSDGIQTITGVYLAMWRKTNVGWKIRSELFVSLGCTGSAECSN